MRLQNLAPEIGIDGDGLPLHRGRGRIGEAVKAVHKANFIIAQRRDEVDEKIRWHAHVGVANQDQIMFGVALKLGDFGDFGVRAGRFAADDEMRVARGIFLKKFLDDFADRVVRVGDAEKNLRLA